MVVDANERWGKRVKNGKATGLECWRIREIFQHRNKVIENLSAERSEERSNWNYINFITKGNKNY